MRPRKHGGPNEHPRAGAEDGAGVVRSWEERMAGAAERKKEDGEAFVARGVRQEKSSRSPP